MTTRSKRYREKVRALGCIVCQLLGLGKTPAELHHLLSGGRRIGDDHVLPLCRTHHRSGVNNADHVSRHPWRKEFERRYGREEDLLEKTKQLMGAIIA